MPNNVIYVISYGSLFYVNNKNNEFVMSVDPFMAKRYVTADNAKYEVESLNKKFAPGWEVLSLTVNVDPVPKSLAKVLSLNKTLGEGNV